MPRLLLMFLACATPDPTPSVAAEPPPEPAKASAPAADPAEATTAADPSRTMNVGTWSGGTVTLADVEDTVKGQLRSAETDYLTQRHQITQGALDELMNQRILEAEAKSRNVAVDELLRLEVEAKASEPTEEEVKAFFESVKRQLQGATIDDVRGRIVDQLKQQQLGSLYRGYIDSLRTKYQVKLSLPYPDLPKVEIALADHDPILGKPDAKVTIVQFAEYQCYYCGRVVPTLDEVRAKYPDDVRIVFKDFPLGMHDRAMPAAVAAHCSGEQSRYWEMNKVLLANQQALQDEDLKRYAKDLGLDAKKFEKCVSSGKYEPLVQADMDIGMTVGVQATPTFFVNGILLSGAQPFEQFASVIDKELSATR